MNEESTEGGGEGGIELVPVQLLDDPVELNQGEDNKEVMQVITIAEEVNINIDNCALISI